MLVKKGKTIPSTTSCFPADTLVPIPMHPGRGPPDRKRPANTYGDPDQTSRRRRHRSAHASSSSPASSSDTQQGASTAGERADERLVGLTREASITAELERQLREQILLNELLQSRGVDPRGGERGTTRFDPMLLPPLHYLRQPAPMERLSYDQEMEMIARQAADRALALESFRLNQSGLFADRYDHRQFPAPTHEAFASSRSLPPREQALQHALRQQRLSQEQRGLQEPLTDLERFSRGLGDYAMIHHHRLRDSTVPPRPPGIPQLSEGEPTQLVQPSMGDMRSSHRLGSTGLGGLLREEEKSSDAKTNSRPMALPSDVEQLTIYQVLIRRSLEYFVAGETDVATSVRGRKQKIRIGQIGVRCKYCAHIPLRQRNKGAVYYAKSLINVYQAAQNIATAHFATESACPYMPAAIREEIAIQRPRRDASKAGRSYWVEACQSMGIIERDDALWFSTYRAGQVSIGKEPTGKSEEI